MTSTVRYQVLTEWAVTLESPLTTFAWLFVLGLFSVGCISRPEQEVVLYTSVDREYSAPILDGFERNHPPAIVSRQFDVEASKTVGLVTRLLEERSRPRCDVFWNNEILHTIRLQREGILFPHRWKIPANWPSSFRAKDGTWVGFAGRARVLLINTARIPNNADEPKSVAELSDARWKGKCGIAYPLFGTTATHFSVLHAKNGDDSMRWFEAVASNAIVLSGNKQVAQAVSSGQLAWGLTDTDDAQVEIENGFPVRILFPDQEEGQPGTLLIPNTVSILSQSPHPKLATELADYLVSETTENRLTMGSASQFPIWPDKANSLTHPRWMEVEFERAADSWTFLAEPLRKIFSAP